MAKAKGLPDREQIIKRMWKLANAQALTEFKRGNNGVVELKFVDRGRLLERLLDTVDHSGEDQVDRFLQAMEKQEG